MKLKLTVSNFSFLITIHNAFVFIDSKSSASVTIQNLTHVHMNIFLTMADPITSQNIELSS